MSVARWIFCGILVFSLVRCGVMGPPINYVDMQKRKVASETPDTPSLAEPEAKEKAE